MAKAVKEFEAGGKKPSALFVHDMNKGWKLFAQTDYYVDNNGVITAFLLKADADDYAAKSGGTVIDFTNLQSMT